MIYDILYNDHIASWVYFPTFDLEQGMLSAFCRHFMWAAESILLDLPCPNSSSLGPPPVRCQQNNHKLTVVRNDTGAAIDQRSWFISWTERQTDSVFEEGSEEQWAIAQCRQPADVTGLGSCIYLVFIKAQDEIREVQEASVFKLCVSVCVFRGGVHTVWLY